MSAVRLIQVRAPHFTAGLVVKQGKVAEAAPIIAYMEGWTWAKASAYISRKRWTRREVV